MKAIYLVIVCLAFPLTVFGEQMSTSKSEYCDSKWYKLSATHGRDSYHALLDEWQQLSDSCAGTGIYEFRLGTLYERLGKKKEFKDIVNKGLSLNSEYHHYLRISELTIVLQDAAERNTLDEETKNTLISGYLDLIGDYPDWVTPYEQLANIYLLFGEPEKSIEMSHKAIQLNQESWAAERCLVIGYTLLNQHQEARKHIRKAIELNRALFSDIEFMTASAWVYTSLGELGTAEAVLERLADSNQNAEQTERFKKALAYLGHKVQALNSTAQ